MRGGHNRLPDEVKQLRGTDQPCRMNPSAPARAPCEIPAAPEHLDADARAIWARLAPLVTARRVVTEVDLVAFEMMVEDVAFGRSVMRDGDASVNQKIAARRQGWAALAQFGLTPATSSKTTQLGEPEKQEDPIAEFRPGGVQ